MSAARPKPKHILLKDQAKSLCGVDLWQQWAFFDLTHVKASPSVPVCQKCLEIARGENKPLVD